MAVLPKQSLEKVGDQVGSLIPICWSEAKVPQSCPTLCDPMDYTVHGILQPRILGSIVTYLPLGFLWLAFKGKLLSYNSVTGSDGSPPIPFSRGSSQPRDWTLVSRIAGGFFTSWATHLLITNNRFLSFSSLSPYKSFLRGSAGKESACSVGDLGSISGLGRSPGEGNGFPLQYSGLENCMDCVVHGVAKSRMSDFHSLPLTKRPLWFFCLITYQVILHLKNVNSFKLTTHWKPYIMKSSCTHIPKADFCLLLESIAILRNVLHTNTNCYTWKEHHLTEVLSKVALPLLSFSLLNGWKEA